MERLQDYANEESPYTERNNFQREPIQEEITNNSSELLKIVKTHNSLNLEIFYYKNFIHIEFFCKSLNIYSIKSRKINSKNYSIKFGRINPMSYFLN